MNSAVKNNIIAIKKTNLICWHRKILQNLHFIMTIFTLFFFYNSKTSDVRKILILDLEFASKNTSNKKKKLFILGYVQLCIK